MTPRPPNTGRYKPMTVGEVARIADVPRETLRTWLRNDVFDRFRAGAQEGGWRRFSDFEALAIGVYARILDCQRDHDAAAVGMLLSAKVLMDEWSTVEGVPYFADETFVRDRFMFFWRGQNGHWEADIVQTNEKFEAAMSERVSNTYSAGAAFSVINLGMILKQVFLALLDVQIDKGDSE